MVFAQESVLDEILVRCEGAYSHSTIRGYRNALKQFQCWCVARNVNWLPAEPDTIAAYVDDQAKDKAIATIKHRVDAIKFAHRMVDVPPPTDNSAVLLAIRRARRRTCSRPTQVSGLTADLLARIVAACPETLAGRRDAALLSVGYDTLCRSSEIAAMCVEHLAEQGSAVRVPRSKADPFGEGRISYLSLRTCDLVKRWLEASKLEEGPLFRGLHTLKVSDRSLSTSSIRRLIKSAAHRAGVAKPIADGLSGHSMRIGAAQDMMLAGFDTISIMQAGGWKTHAVMARYVENAFAEKMHQDRWQKVNFLLERN